MLKDPQLYAKASFSLANCKWYTHAFEVSWPRVCLKGAHPSVLGLGPIQLSTVNVPIGCALRPAFLEASSQ